MGQRILRRWKRSRRNEVQGGVSYFDSISFGFEIVGTGFQHWFGCMDRR
jgi:hypothetical protein